MPLRKSDAESVLRSMRRGGVLCDVDTHRLDAKNGVILVACGDGDQFHDLFGYKASILAPQQNDVPPRIHPLTLNGGALLIPEESPFNAEIPYDQVLLRNIDGAMNLKGIRTVAVYVHAPCGMARTANLDIADVIRLLVSAKRRIRRELERPGLHVAAFCHVDWLEGKRTYFVSGDAWDIWKESPPLSTASPNSYPSSSAL